MTITCLQRLSSSAIACSAVDSVGPSGAFTTRMPRRVASARSMRSTPMPGRAIMRRHGPMRSITSPVTNVAPSTMIASAVDASAYQSLRSPTALTEMVARPSSTARASGCSALPVQTCACCILALSFWSRSCPIRAPSLNANVVLQSQSCC